jgi:hypothetical protein
VSAVRAAGRLARNAFTGPGALTRAAVAAAVVSTLAAQHHHTAVFNRVHRHDWFSLLPGWRFFAPTPGTHDYHVLYRTMDRARRPSRWRGLDLIVGRSPRQLVWYPARRREKAVFDLVSELLVVLDRGFEVITRKPAYRLLEAHVTARIRAEDAAGDAAGEVAGYQIALVRSAGYDPGEQPSLIMVSPYTPLVSGTAGPVRRSLGR